MKRAGVLVLVAVAACGGKIAPDDDAPTPAPAATSTATPVPTVTSSPTAPPSMCNDVVETSVIATNVFPGDAPAKDTGGTVADGTYDLTQVIYDTGVPMNPMPSGTSMTIEIAGIVANVVGSDGDGTGRYTAKLTTSGTTLTLITACSYPAGGIGTTEHYDYTATDTQLMLSEGGTRKTVRTTQVFTKR